MIELNNLTKTYGELTAVDDVSLEIKENEIFGIIGLSGAGKSTLVRLINRLEEADRGQVLIDNTDITALSSSDLNDMRKKTGMIFQSFNLLQSRSVFRNVAYPLEISGWKKEKIRARVREMLNLVGLEDKEKSRISTLSGGQKQRVAIARALASGPKVLFCDEATSALDPQTTHSILKLIKKVQKEFGLTVVMITHQMEVIKEVCDRVALMENGKVVESDTVETVFTTPKSALAKEFVAHLRKDEHDYMDFFRYEKNEDAILIKLHYTKEHAGKPVVYDLIKNTNVVVSILSGDIFRLTSSNVGELVLELKGSHDERHHALSYLKSTNTLVEEINV